jgi:hypothetical protein
MDVGKHLENISNLRDCLWPEQFLGRNRRTNVKSLNLQARLHTSGERISLEDLIDTP